MMAVPTPYRCWVVEYQRSDGSPAGRWEYFRTRGGAHGYLTRLRRNGLTNNRVFQMVEVTQDAK